VSAPHSSVPSRPQVSPRGRSRRWVWFFSLLAALAVAAVVIPIVYNLRQQLRPEQLAEARERWRQNGTSDYDLAFEVKYDTDPRADEHIVQVRDGKVVSWVVNGEKLVHAPDGTLPLQRAEASPGSEALLEMWKRPDVEGLFNMMRKWLEEDAASGSRRNFATANFDSRDGHPLRYVHRVAGTRQRQEWNIKLTRVLPGAKTEGR
jgi:hypothetical protein